MSNVLLLELEEDIEGRKETLFFSLCFLLETRVKVTSLSQLMPLECSIEKGKGYDNTISCAVVVSVSTSYGRCYNLALS